MKLFATNEEAAEGIDFARWLDRGILAAVVLAGAVAVSSLDRADPDLWGHVQYGRDALSGGPSLTTTYSYLAAGQRWINPEVLTQVAFGLLADWGGAPGLLIAKCLLGLAIIGAILARALKQGAGMIAACGLTLTVAIVIGGQWALQPRLASFALFAVLLALLSYCFAGWEGRCQYPLALFRPWRGEDDEAPGLEYSIARLKMLWLAPLLFLVWANADRGFVVGLGFYLAYLALRGLEAIVHKGPQADGMLRRLVLMAVAAVAATLLNPHGPWLHWWLVGELPAELGLLNWPSLALLSPSFLPLWLLLAAAAAAVICSRRSRDVAQVVLLGLILGHVLGRPADIPLLAIAIGWWLPLHVDSLLVGLGIGHRFRTDEEIRYGWAPPESGAFTAAFSPRVQQLMALLLVVGICGAAGKLATHLTAIKVDRQQAPIGAADYLIRRGLSGKMVVSMPWAPYTIAALGQRGQDGSGIQVQVDSRGRAAYRQELLDMHLDFLLGDESPARSRGGQADPARVLREGRPDLVLISRRHAAGVSTMEQQEKAWVLLYQDGLAQLWGRAAKYDDSKSPDYLEPRYREVGEAPQRGYVRWPAIPRHQTADSADPSIIAESHDSPRRKPGES